MAKLLSPVLADVHSQCLGVSTETIRARVLEEKTQATWKFGHLRIPNNHNHNNHNYKNYNQAPKTETPTLIITILGTPNHLPLHTFYASPTS